MPKAAFRRDEELQDVLKIAYGNARGDGLSGKEAHAFAFERMIAFKHNGRVPADPEMRIQTQDNGLG
jgi:hypothetical protein